MSDTVTDTKQLTVTDTQWHSDWHETTDCDWH